MKIVLDTNCLLRVLSKNSKYRCIWDAFLCNEFVLCYINEILHEYEEVLKLNNMELEKELKKLDKLKSIDADLFKSQYLSIREKFTSGHFYK